MRSVALNSGTPVTCKSTTWIFPVDQVCSRHHRGPSKLNLRLSSLVRVCLCARVRESAQALCVSKCGLPVFHLQAAGVKDGVRENVGLQDGRDPAANEARHTERSKIYQSRALSCSCPQLARTTNLTPLHVFNDVPFVSAPQADFLSRCFCAQLDISHIHTKRK